MGVSDEKKTEPLTFFVRFSWPPCGFWGCELGRWPVHLHSGSWRGGDEYNYCDGFEHLAWLNTRCQAVNAVFCTERPQHLSFEWNRERWRRNPHGNSLWTTILKDQFA